MLHQRTILVARCLTRGSAFLFETKSQGPHQVRADGRARCVVKFLLGLARGGGPCEAWWRGASGQRPSANCVLLSRNVPHPKLVMLSQNLPECLSMAKPIYPKTDHEKAKIYLHCMVEIKERLGVIEKNPPNTNAISVR